MFALCGPIYINAYILHIFSVLFILQCYSLFFVNIYIYIYIESCIGFVGTNSPLRFANGRGRWLDHGQGHDAPFPTHAGIFISTIDIYRVFGIIEST